MKGNQRIKGKERREREMEFSEGGNKGKRDRSANHMQVLVTQCYPESSTLGLVFRTGI